MTYQARVVDNELQERLRAAGAVVIEGPKAWGKPETASQIAASSVLLDVDPRAQAPAIPPGIAWSSCHGSG